MTRMASSSWFSAALLFGSVVALSGCGGEPPPPPPRDVGPRDVGVRDAGPRDTGPGLDGDLPDAPAPDDADLPDTPERDGGPVPDGGIVAGCRLDGDLTELGFDELRPRAARAVDVAYADDAFWFTWPEGGPSVSRVRVHRWPASGTPFTRDATPDTVLHRDAAVAAAGAGVVVGWIDNGGAGFQASGRALRSLGTFVGDAVPWTAELVTHDWLDIATLASGRLVSWVESDGLGGPAYVAVRRIADDAMPLAPMRSLMGTTTGAGRAAIALAGTGAALAWSDLSDVRLVGLDDTGAPIGGAQIVSTEHNADGSVAIATNLVAFGVRVGGARPEVRVRAFDEAGVLSGVERIVTTAPEVGIEPGVAEYGGGHLVAYRALPDGTLTAPTVRLAFVPPTGSPVPVFDVLRTSQDGGPVRIATAPDGRIAVAWAELTLAGSAERLILRAARIVCD
jgi:hypothetical protein